LNNTVEELRNEEKSLSVSAKEERNERIQRLEADIIYKQTQYQKIVKLSLDTSYQFNRYQDEEIIEEPDPTKKDPHEDITHPAFWTARKLEDKDVIRRQLCLDMITFSSPKPLLHDDMTEAKLVCFGVSILPWNHLQLMDDSQ
jgi:hypothetical protein